LVGTDTQEDNLHAEAGISWAKAVAAIKRGTSRSTLEQTEEEFLLTSPTDSRILKECDGARLILLIDEIHQATSQFADELAKFLKSYANANCRGFKIVLLGTSSDAVSLVRRDPGINRLIQEVQLRPLTDKESAALITKGMEALGLSITPEAIAKLIRTSVGSPNILQYLCLEIAEKGVARNSRFVSVADVDNALDEYVNGKQAVLHRVYLRAIESVGKMKLSKAHPQSYVGVG
jgi:Holliday junction resolvasome RuvABC ATP-dependent DNA helicase subunit